MSATGTPTPNIGLRRPQGTDPASVDDINYNSALLDTKLGAVGNTSLQDQIDTLSTNTAQNLGKVQDGLAIVANGNTHVAIPADYFVYVKGHNSLSEGLYKNTSGSTIAANATLSTSNLTADDNGGLNSVYDALNSNKTNYSSATISSYAYTEPDAYAALFAELPNKYKGTCSVAFKNGVDAFCIVNKFSASYGTVITMPDSGNAIYAKCSNGTWTTNYIALQ